MENWKEKATRLEAENRMKKLITDEQKRCDEAYAIKIVEWIVFTMVAIITSGFLYALISYVFEQNGK